MASQTLEVSRFTVTVTKGTAIADAVIGTVSGAVKGVKAVRVNEGSTNVTYEVIVVHDDGTPVALEYSVKQFILTENTTPVLSATGMTVAGATQAIDIIATHSVGIINTFDIFAIHLNA